MHKVDLFSKDTPSRVDIPYSDIVPLVSFKKLPKYTVKRDLFHANSAVLGYYKDRYSGERFIRLDHEHRSVVRTDAYYLMPPLPKWNNNMRYYFWHYYAYLFKRTYLFKQPIWHIGLSDDCFFYKLGVSRLHKRYFFEPLVIVPLRHKYGNVLETSLFLRNTVRKPLSYMSPRFYFERIYIESVAVRYFESISNLLNVNLVNIKLPYYNIYANINLYIKHDLNYTIGFFKKLNLFGYSTLGLLATGIKGVMYDSKDNYVDNNNYFNRFSFFILSRSMINSKNLFLSCNAISKRLFPSKQLGFSYKKKYGLIKKLPKILRLEKKALFDVPYIITFLKKIVEDKRTREAKLIIDKKLKADKREAKRKSLEEVCYVNQGELEKPQLINNNSNPIVEKSPLSIESDIYEHKKSKGSKKKFDEPKDFMIEQSDDIELKFVGKKNYSERIKEYASIKVEDDNKNICIEKDHINVVTEEDNFIEEDNFFEWGIRIKKLVKKSFLELNKSVENLSLGEFLCSYLKTFDNSICRFIMPFFKYKKSFFRIKLNQSQIFINVNKIVNLSNLLLNLSKLKNFNIWIDQLKKQWLRNFHKKKFWKLKKQVKFSLDKQFYKTKSYIKGNFNSVCRYSSFAWKSIRSKSCVNLADVYNLKYNYISTGSFNIVRLRRKNPKFIHKPIQLWRPVRLKVRRNSKLRPGLVLGHFGSMPLKQKTRIDRSPKGIFDKYNWSNSGFLIQRKIKTIAKCFFINGHKYRVRTFMMISQFIFYMMRNYYLRHYSSFNYAIESSSIELALYTLVFFTSRFKKRNIKHICVPSISRYSSRFVGVNKFYNLYESL